MAAEWRGAALTAALTGAIWLDGWVRGFRWGGFRAAAAAVRFVGSAEAGTSGVEITNANFFSSNLSPILSFFSVGWEMNVDI